ncbi:VOC family protein [Sphingobium limneticum]|jgi:catechol 2,3-dioxygenase-like lactoylglutathione lyase family enzyme|uniref:VOC family protein n=1 Tax=Sphingobium limneticum TaxID=1007511 RepID=A0A5J5IBG1_9SPHN|nr:VOC family protein [Sphingobium limneticum]KAA9020654.1 VOC family protein [Sphingobium limneticum]KAA9032980.1 VOC family protein [Sphingobium limneticum]
MFSHVMVGASDMAASKAFYDATFGAIGAKPGFFDDKGRAIYLHDGALFLVTTPIDGAPACHANGGTIGFKMASPQEADAWHAAGVAAGGTACEDPPGVREGGFGKLYLAYLRDPAGNKLCALHRIA